MNYVDVLPTDINNLPTYVVDSEIFICTAVILVLLVLVALAFMIMWICRLCYSIHNPDYMIDFVVNYEAAMVSKRQIDEQKGSVLEMSEIDKYKSWNRVESRALEFVAVMVVVALNVGTHTSRAATLVCFALALILFTVLNLGRACGDRFWLVRALWLLPVLGLYVVFFIYDKNLTTK